MFFMFCLFSVLLYCKRKSSFNRRNQDHAPFQAMATSFLQWTRRPVRVGANGYQVPLGEQPPIAWTATTSTLSTTSSIAQCRRLQHNVTLAADGSQGEHFLTHVKLQQLWTFDLDICKVKICYDTCYHMLMFSVQQALLQWLGGLRGAHLHVARVAQKRYLWSSFLWPFNRSQNPNLSRHSHGCSRCPVRSWLRQDQIGATGYLDSKGGWRLS